jgi:transposase
MKKTRRRYNREFKISVISELEGGKTVAQIAREYGIHPSLPSRWREELAENPEKAFRRNGNPYKENIRIFEKDEISVQSNFGRSSKKDNRQTFKIIRDALSKDPQLSIRNACMIHGASRSGYYKWMKRPEPVSFAVELNIDVKNQIQGIVLKFPEYGYRRVTMELRSRGYVVNHKRVLRIMRDLRDGTGAKSAGMKYC